MSCVCQINVPILATLAVAFVAIRVENLSGLFHRKKLTVLGILSRTHNYLQNPQKKEPRNARSDLLVAMEPFLSVHLLGSVTWTVFTTITQS